MKLLKFIPFNTSKAVVFSGGEGATNTPVSITFASVFSGVHVARSLTLFWCQCLFRSYGDLFCPISMAKTASLVQWLACTHPLWYTVKVLLFVDFNFPGFWKYLCFVGFLIRGFRTYLLPIKGKLVFRWV